VKANRTSVPITTNIKPEMLARARADADRRGYTTLRAYLEKLIAQGLDDEDDPDESPVLDEQGESLAAAYPSSAWAFGPGILGNRVVMALEALAERIRAGEDMEPLRTDLTSLRFEIAQNLLGLRKDYDREVEVRDRRHFARFGTVDE
jgi:hypothetical protein